MSELRNHLMGVLQSDINDSVRLDHKERNTLLCEGIMEAIRIIDNDRYLDSRTDGWIRRP